jgi:hypothetical protein
MSKLEDMRKFRDELDDEPDGAFFQLALDMHGWDADDWAWFAKREARLANGGSAAELSGKQTEVPPESGAEERGEGK